MYRNSVLQDSGLKSQVPSTKFKIPSSELHATTERPLNDNKFLQTTNTTQSSTTE